MRIWCLGFTGLPVDFVAIFALDESEAEDSPHLLFSQRVDRPVRQNPLGPVDLSFRALSGRLTFTVRLHKFDKDSLFLFCIEAMSVEGSRFRF